MGPGKVDELLWNSGDAVPSTAAIAVAIAAAVVVAAITSTSVDITVQTTAQRVVHQRGDHQLAVDGKLGVDASLQIVL